MVEAHGRDQNSNAGKDRKADDQRAPTAANAATQQEQQDRDNDGGGRKIGPDRPAGHLNLIPQPRQWPEYPGNDGAEQDDQLAEQPQQRSNHGSRLAGGRKLPAAVTDAVIEP